MDVFLNVLLAIHVLVAAGIIGLVLLQHGKGADMGAAFGSGSSGSLFGATGSANFLSRTTGVLATVFFITSIGLTWLASHHRAGDSVGVMKNAPEAVVAPASNDAKKDAAGAADSGKGGAATGTGTEGAKPGDVPK